MRNIIILTTIVLSTILVSSCRNGRTYASYSIDDMRTLYIINRADETGDSVIIKTTDTCTVTLPIMSVRVGRNRIKYYPSISRKDGQIYYYATCSKY